jgi:hypothetical protein
MCQFQWGAAIAKNGELENVGKYFHGEPTDRSEKAGCVAIFLLKSVDPGLEIRNICLNRSFRLLSILRIQTLNSCHLLPFVAG